MSNPVDKTDEITDVESLYAELIGDYVAENGRLGLQVRELSIRLRGARARIEELEAVAAPRSGAVGGGSGGAGAAGDGAE